MRYMQIRCLGTLSGSKDALTTLPQEECIADSMCLICPMLQTSGDTQILAGVLLDKQKKKGGLSEQEKRRLMWSIGFGTIQRSGSGSHIKLLKHWSKQTQRGSKIYSCAAGHLLYSTPTRSMASRLCGSNSI